MTRFIAAVAAIGLLSLTACQPQQDDAFGQKVRAYLMEHPEVIEEAVMKLQEKKLAQAAEATKVGLVKSRAALERDPRDFVANPDGKITVIEFYDYRCGYCKTSAPEVMKLVRENPDIRFVFKEFPIFGGASEMAARIAVSPPARAKTLELFERFMAEKALNDASIDRHLREVGVDPAQARAAAATPAVSKHIADVHALAQSLSIEGTPAFIVGDTVISGADMPALRAAIAQARSGDLKTVGGVAMDKAS